MSEADTSALSQGPQAATQDPNAATAPTPAQPTSRLGAILSSVAKTVDTGLAGIPNKGRPSFVTGLGEGARAEQAAQATQQAIKFKSFDDQVRMSELHNQDIKMQNDNQAQQDAHNAAELNLRKMANDAGIDWATLANHGPAVTDNLTAQTAASGSASVPDLTHVSADGENIYMPKDPDSQKTRDGQKQMYSTLGPALGLPSLPQGASFVPPRLMNMLTNKVNGFGLDGNPIKHDELPGMMGAAQAQRDSLAKNGGTPAQLKTMDNMIGIYKANLDALDTHAAGVHAKNKQAELDAENSPENVAAAGKKAATVEQAKLDVTNSPANQDAAAKGAAKKASAEQGAKSTGELNAVAFDPNYQNPDGTKGANVVMNKEDAQAKGLQHYKSNPEKLNATVAGFNDVQNKLNQLAEIANDPKRMGDVKPGLAAAMLEHGKGISLEGGMLGAHLDTSRVNEGLYAEDVQKANQATRDYVTALVGAHEAVTQIPRLQTFGQSSRMTQQQMEAAVNLLPHPGDGTMAAQKMRSLQGMLDPLRKQVPHMPGAETLPSWLEKEQQQQRQAAPQQAPPPSVGKFNPQTQAIDYHPR